MYEQLPDATRLLLASHKVNSQQRRESLRLALNTDYHITCAALQNAKLTSNEFLFGEDFTKSADEALKAKRLANKLTGSNVADGNSRGCGYQNRTYLQYQNKRSEFPQYQNQWQYAHQMGTMEARGTQMNRREHLSQIQEIATSQVHQPPIIENLKNTPDNFCGWKISDNFASWALSLISGFATSSGCTGWI